MQRQREVRPVGHKQLVLGPHAARPQRVELGEERLRIQDHPVPDETHGALDDAGGNLVQHEFAGTRVHRMARVGPALVAHDQVGALGEHVDDLAFALVAPLGADDHDAVGFRSEHGTPTAAKTPRRAGRSSIL